MNIETVFIYLIINLVCMLTFGMGIIIDAGDKFTYSYLPKEIFEIHKELTYIGRIILYGLILLFIPAISFMYLSIAIKDLAGFIVKISFRDE